LEINGEPDFDAEEVVELDDSELVVWSLIWKIENKRFLCDQKVSLKIQAEYTQNAR
jgi:hypothetical protein